MASALTVTAGVFAVSPAASAKSAPKPLTILVTNDDGYNAPGIDTVVQALRKLPRVTVKVVAPATNQSGTGSKTTAGTLTTMKVKTLSGYPAIAVQGYPADTIRAALGQLHLHPNLVVSGVNFGQNLGPVLDASGTVGAARAAAARGIPAVASSQGLGNPVAFPVTAQAVIKWVTSQPFKAHGDQDAEEDDRQHQRALMRHDRLAQRNSRRPGGDHRQPDCGVGLLIHRHQSAGRCHRPGRGLHRGRHRSGDAGHDDVHPRHNGAAA